MQGIDPGRLCKRQECWPLPGILDKGWAANRRYVRPWLPRKKNWWPFCSEQLHRLIIHQNAWIFKRNWLIPSPPAISIKNLKKTMKMTWLHKFFGLFFIPANGRAKSAQQLISTVLPFHPLYFPWLRTFKNKLGDSAINVRRAQQFCFVWQDVEHTTWELGNCFHPSSLAWWPCSDCLPCAYSNGVICQKVGGERRRRN